MVLIRETGAAAGRARAAGSRSLVWAEIYLLAALLVPAALIFPGVVTAQTAGSEIAALAYDEVAGVLIKADPHAIYRSADGGVSWEEASVPLNPGGSISDVAIGADGASMWVAGPGAGVLRSDDSGSTWKSRGTGLPSLDVVSLTTHVDQPDTAYAYMPADGIYRTRDAGATWQLMDRGPAGVRQLVHSNLPGSMETGWLYAATDHGVEISMDCFCLWRDAGVSTGEVSGVAYDRAQPQLVYAAAADGLFRSANGGLDWERAEAPAGTLTAIVVTPIGLYAAVDGRLFKSTDNAKSWEEVGG